MKANNSNTGHANASTDWVFYTLTLPGPYTIRSGDRLYVRQYQAAGSVGRINAMRVERHIGSWTVPDQYGMLALKDTTTGSCHNRTIYLSSAS